MNRFSLRFLTFALIFFACETASVRAQTTLLKANRYLDVEAGKFMEPASILVENGIISSINPTSVPDGVSVVDLGDVTLLPGLMDLHTHLTGELEGDWVNRVVRETPADDALRGAKNARITLLAGFTTVRNLGAGGFSDVALAKAIRRGFVPGPRMVVSGNALGITGGHCDVTGYRPGILELGPESGVADGPDEVLKAVRYQIKHGAGVIKTCATAGVLSFEGPVGAQQYSENELRVMVEEAARHGVKVAAHAHGSEGILAAVRAGVASIEHGSMLTDEIIGEMLARGTYLVPTTYLTGAIDLDNLPPPIRAKAEYVLPIAVRSVERAVRAGVKIAFGTDAAVYPHGDNAREFKALTDRGMTPLQAIRAATVNAADLLGVDDRGTLEAGRLADIIGVKGNPLYDITVLEHVKFVMKDGTIFKRGE
jgi:imidazolonepropionase-like amidohydrolase